MVDHEEIKRTIEKYSIPKGTVARIADVWPTDFSAWLNGRQTLNEKKTQRIAAAVADIIRVIETMPMRVDLSDPKNVQRLITAVNDALMQIELFEAEDAPDVTNLRIKAVNETLT